VIEIHLFIKLFKSPTYVVLGYEPINNSWFLSSGYEVELIKSLSQYFNFTYRLINCNEVWGELLPNKTWNGVIGKIVSKV
jgi:hypothetical protein